MESIVLVLREQIRESGSQANLDDIVSSLGEHFEQNDEALAHLSARHLAPQDTFLAQSLKDREAELSLRVKSVPDAAMILSCNGVVLAANQAAVHHFGLDCGDSIIALGVAQIDFAAFVQRCGAAFDGQALFVAHPPNSPERLILAGRRMPELDAFLVSAITWSWPPALLEEVRRLFSLTEREAIILTNMMSGQSAGQIAERDGRALGTVRQQIKAVLAKLEVSSQAQALALIASTAMSWHRLSVTPFLGSGDNVQFLTLTRGRRRIGIRGFGLPGGQPVLLVHGAVFGVGDLAVERAAARDAGLWVLAAEKPGYGRTSPESSDLVDTMVDDMLALLDHAGVQRTVVLAHDAGTIAAFRLAYRSPDRVIGIVAAPATPPMRSWSQTKDMPRSHRIHAWAAQRVPRLMDMMVTLGVSQIQRQGVSIMPELFFGGCDFDRLAWSPSEKANALGAVFRLMAAQNAHGFRRDMLLTNIDWSHWAHGMEVPVELLHGQKSRTVSLNAITHFAASLPKARVVTVEDGGHTLPLTHPALAFERVHAITRTFGSAPRLRNFGPVVAHTQSPAT